MAKLLRRYVVAPSGCWEWTGTRNQFGYGMICVGAWYSGKITTVGAHKLQWERHNGPVPEGLIMRHKCDNRGCINPDHLEVGTYADNMRDTMERGRHASQKKWTAPAPVVPPPPVLSDWQRAEWLKRYG